MKNLILFGLLLSITLLNAQVDTDSTYALDQNSFNKTPKLKSLYQKAVLLESKSNVTAIEIEANRQAIKEAWMEINPEIAALYKPVDNQGKLPEIIQNVEINGVFVPQTIKKREENFSQKDWSTDKLILDDWIDGGIDMDVTHEGHIYITHYKNDIDFGGPFDIIYVHRSLDGGNTFELWKTAQISAPVRKAKLISIDGPGSAWNYINVYFTTETNNFQLVRWGIDDGSFDANIIATEVSYFDVDRNYVNSTDAQRVFAVYDKLTAGGCHRLYSARSTAGTYGINWVDEATVGNTCSIDLGVAYGVNGYLYTSHRGQSSNFLYYNANSNYNDPASWSPRLTVENNPDFNNKEVSIISTRDVFPANNVYIVSNFQVQSNSENYLVYYQLIDNTVVTSQGLIFPGLLDFEFRLPSLWIKRENNTQNFSLSVGIDEIGFSGKVGVQKINEVSFGVVSDSGNEVYFDVPSAVAETIDGLPCVAFSGTSAGGNPRGLYFDANTELLGVVENTLDKVKIFPNPTLNEINFQAPFTIERVVIFNNLGHVMVDYEPNTNIFSYDLSELNSGMYYVKITGNNLTKTEKIIKK